jgi:hypothetical protein
MVPKLGWTIDASSALPQIVLVGWLKGSLPMPDNVRATLEANGITADDYPQMLAADDPTGATSPDPARFVPVTAYPYEYISDTFFYQNSNNYTSTSGSGSSTSHTVKVTAGGALLPRKVSGSFTWKHESQQTMSTGSSNTETFLLSMPSTEYTGPTNMYLYIDKIYNTFMVSPIRPL